MVKYGGSRETGSPARQAHCCSITLARFSFGPLIGPLAASNGGAGKISTLREHRVDFNVGPLAAAGRRNIPLVEPCGDSLEARGKPAE